MGRPHRIATVAAVIALSTLVCAAIGRLIGGGDPLLPLEVAGAGVLAAWATTMARSMWGAARLGRAMTRMSHEATVAGVRCRIMAVGGRSAFVAGSIRPRVYVAAGLLGVLEPDELRAVALHEEHHRRRRDPLRALAIGAWGHLLPRWQRGRDALDRRLEDLEHDADRFALRHGATDGALAGALLKCEPAAGGLGFGTHGTVRVARLLATHHGAPTVNARALPYEWLPVLAGVATVIGCHLLG